MPINVHTEIPMIALRPFPKPLSHDLVSFGCPMLLHHALAKVHFQVWGGVVVISDISGKVAPPPPPFEPSGAPELEVK